MCQCSQLMVHMPTGMKSNFSGLARDATKLLGGTTPAGEILNTNPRNIRNYIKGKGINLEKQPGALHFLLSLLATTHITGEHAHADLFNRAKEMHTTVCEYLADKSPDTCLTPFEFVPGVAGGDGNPIAGGDDPLNGAPSGAPSFLCGVVSSPGFTPCGPLARRGFRHHLPLVGSHFSHHHRLEHYH